VSVGFLDENLKAPKVKEEVKNIDDTIDDTIDDKNLKLLISVNIVIELVT